MIATLKAMDATARMIVALFASAIVLCAVAIFYLLITAGPRERAREAERYAARIEQARKADGVKAIERAANDADISRKQKELSDAVSQVPDGPVDAAGLAYGCGVMRQQRAERDLPAACRPRGGG